MASIVKRPRSDGSTGYQIRWLEHGRQQSTTADTLAAARRVKAIVEATGTYTDEMGRPDVPTVREQSETFLRRGTRANAQTREGYRRTIAKHILPAFGDVAVTALTVDLLTDWGNAIEGSAKTQYNVTALMHGILKSAIPDHLASNPWERVNLEQRKKPKRRPHLTMADVLMIVDEVPEHYKPLVSTLATTGMRWGEASALTVADAQVVEGRVVFTIDKAVKHRARQGDEPEEPKTDRARRVVAGPPSLTAVLEPLMARPRGAPLFATVTGKRMRNSTFHTLVWQPAVKAAVEKGLHVKPRIHDLRAAAATWWIEQGVPVAEVADRLGHESFLTTLDIYRRINPQSVVDAADVMDRLLTAALAERRALPAPPEQADD